MRELEGRVAGFQAATAKHESEVDVLTKENRQLKKTVYAYQLWSKVPGGLNNKQPVAADYFVCCSAPVRRNLLSKYTA
jgi:hypothetical protein